MRIGIVLVVGNVAEVEAGDVEQFRAEDQTEHGEYGLERTQRAGQGHPHHPPDGQGHGLLLVPVLRRPLPAIAYGVAAAPSARSTSFTTPSMPPASTMPMTTALRTWSHR